MPLGPQCGDRGGKLRPFCPRADPYLCHCLSVLVGAGALRGQLARWPPCYDLPEQVQGGTEQHPLAPGLLEVHAARAPHVRPSACARGQRVCPETPEHSGCCRPNCAPQVHVLKRSPSVTDRGTHARHQRSPPTPLCGSQRLALRAQRHPPHRRAQGTNAWDGTEARRAHLGASPPQGGHDPALDCRGSGVGEWTRRPAGTQPLER